MDFIIKIVKELIKILLCLLGVGIVLIIGIFIYQKISIANEENLHKENGELIKIYDDEFVNTIHMGNGDKTIVILGDIDVLVPSLEYYNLAKKLSSKYEVIIIENLGHGYSSFSDKERSLDNIVDEIRTVLDYKKYNDKYIFLSHGKSGIYALSYANKYSSEVAGLINMDTTMPNQTIYDYSLMIDYPHFYSYYSKLGIARFMSDLFADQVKYNDEINNIDEEEVARFKYLYSTKSYNITYIDEINNSYKNMELLKDVKYKSNIPVFDILSKNTIDSVKNNEEYSNGFTDFHAELYTNEDIQYSYEVEGNHKFYRHNEDEVYEIINVFIDKNVS